MRKFNTIRGIDTVSRVEKLAAEPDSFLSVGSKMYLL